MPEMGMGILGSTSFNLESTGKHSVGVLRIWLNDRSGGISWNAAKTQGFGFLEIEVHSEFSNTTVIELTEEKVDELEINGFIMQPNETVIFHVFENTQTGY